MPAQTHLIALAFLREETTSIAPNGKPAYSFYSQCNVIVQRKYAQFAAYRVNRADIRARCIFTLRQATAVVQLWSLMTRIREINRLVTTQRNPDSPDATLRKPLTGTATDTFRRIRNNKPVHDPPLH